ncbi:MAG TPA: rod shape-determining protein [Candidatus Binataceae bacterium]|nr:rod shape-determining protein [Candidatus Binataceae bacterium]
MLFGRLLPRALAGGLAIDLGTANTLIYSRKRGIVCNEPSVVALRYDSKGMRKVLAVGAEAKAMLGRNPGSVVVARPLSDGVIADFEAAREMLRYFIRKVCRGRFMMRPRVVVSVPSEISQVEKRAVKESAESAGAAEVILMTETIAAALGAGLPILEPQGSMVVDIGGGTSDVAVLSMGSIVASRSLRAAGDRMDREIMEQIKHRHNLRIGERTAEMLKLMLGSVIAEPETRTLEIMGRDEMTGQPKTVEVDDDEIREALRGPVNQLIESVHEVLEQTPPELLKDVADNGLMLTGGGALLRNLDVLLSRETGVVTHISEDPLSAVVRGAGRIVEDPTLLDRLSLE